MSLPIIGITSSFNTYKEGAFSSQKRFVLNYFYTKAIADAGAVPLILPILFEEASILRQLSLIDGLLFSGGDDLDPSLYGEEPHPALEKISPQRDRYELTLIEQAHKLHKPILGICRGMQLINVAFGGSLYQDLPQQYPRKELFHSQQIAPEQPIHSVTIVPATRLHSIFGTLELATNSLHHQGIKTVAPGFLANAYSEDKLVEGIEMQNAPFVLGVQWHPEQMISCSTTSMHLLFEAFIAHIIKGLGK